MLPHNLEYNLKYESIMKKVTFIRRIPKDRKNKNKNTTKCQLFEVNIQYSWNRNKTSIKGILVPVTCEGEHTI